MTSLTITKPMLRKSTYRKIGSERGCQETMISVLVHIRCDDSDFPPGPENTEALFEDRTRSIEK